MTANALNLDTIAKPADKVLWNQIDDEAIVLNLNNGYYYTLNSVGCEMWKLLDGTQTVRNIARVLCEIYDATQEQIESDMLTLLSECQNEELITVVE